MVEEHISKSLAVLIALAIVVSVGGTLITLNSIPAPQITGYDTSSQQGTASFTVSALTQITVTDSTVDFGTCQLNNSQTLTYDSNASNGNSLELDDDGTCGGTFPDNMTLENTGNKYVNLTINSNVSAANFIDASSGEGSFYFVGGNAEASACNSGLQTSFTNFTAAATNYTLCLNFSPVNTEDELSIAYRVRLPSDTKGGTKSATITITGEDSIQ